MLKRSIGGDRVELSYSHRITSIDGHYGTLNIVHINTDLADNSNNVLLSQRDTLYDIFDCKRRAYTFLSVLNSVHL